MPKLSEKTLIILALIAADVVTTVTGHEDAAHVCVILAVWVVVLM